MTSKEFYAAYPIVQSTHSGLWGWERVYDCVNLQRCVFHTRQSANQHRKRAYADRTWRLETVNKNTPNETSHTTYHPSESGPFETRRSAEDFARAQASTMAVVRVEIVEREDS
jgi:hypothetical protein